MALGWRTVTRKLPQWKFRTPWPTAATPCKGTAHIYVLEVLKGVRCYYSEAVYRKSLETFNRAQFWEGKLQEDPRRPGYFFAMLRHTSDERTADVRVFEGSTVKVTSTVRRLHHHHLHHNHHLPPL